MEQLTKEQLILQFVQLKTQYDELYKQYEELLNRSIKNVSLSVFNKNISNSTLNYIIINKTKDNINWIELANKIKFDYSSYKKITGTTYKLIVNTLLEKYNGQYIEICYCKNDIYYKYINKIQINESNIKVTKISEQVEVLNDNINIVNELTYEELLQNLNFSYIEQIQIGDTNLLNQINTIDLVNYENRKIKVSTLYDLYKYYYPLDNEEFKAYKLKFYMNKIYEKWIESEIRHEIVLYRKLKNSDIKYKFVC